jgi:hypothetical protein
MNTPLADELLGRVPCDWHGWRKVASHSIKQSLRVSRLSRQYGEIGLIGLVAHNFKPLARECLAKCRTFQPINLP